MNLCIGIDPSMNSSGLCELFVDEEGNVIKEKFFIIKADRLTKRELTAQEKYSDFFRYVLYEKLDTAVASDNHEFEEFKTLNMLNIIDCFKCIIEDDIKHADNVFVIQEGISYGSSIRTKSIYDLAGLNYLLRAAFIREDNLHFTIATPSEVKKFTTGRGNCDKNSMVELFKLTHSDFDLPKIDDISDAYWMATYAKKIMTDMI